MTVPRITAAAYTSYYLGPEPETRLETAEAWVGGGSTSDLPENTLAAAEKWAAGLPLKCYAIDDETAIQVTDGTVEVISEGHWKRFAP
jgi:hypothetical protein